jgi:TP901 family phage tail tape measure protein
VDFYYFRDAKRVEKMSRMYEVAFNIMAKMGPSFNQAFSSASDRLTQLNTRVSGLKGEMKELDTQHRKGTISVLEYSASYERLTTQLYKAEQRQKSYAKAYALQNKVSQSRNNARANMMDAAETAVAVGGPVYTAMNFETAMAGVAKQVDGARNNAGQLTEVYYQAQSQVMQASNDMKILPDTMAKAFAMSAKSGVQGMQNIEKFARTGIMMGTAFEQPVDQITEDFAKIGSAMGISLQTGEGIDQLVALADTVNYLDDQSNAAGADIIQVLKRTAGTATLLLPTLSRTTLAGMSTAMLQMGETGETAGTALNALFTRVAAAPTQSKKFQEALGVVGLTAEELQSGALKDAEGTIMNLFERIGKLDAASKNNVLAELFGAEHIDNLSKISGNYAEFLRVIQMGNSEAAKGSMMREFSIQAQTSARQLEGLKASAARTAITYGAVLLPEVNALAGAMSRGADWLVTLNKEFPMLSGAAVKLTAGVLGGTVALSALAWAGWAVIYPFVNLYSWAKKVEMAQKTLTAATWLTANAKTGLTIVTSGLTRAQMLLNAAFLANPVGMVIAGVALLAGSVYLLYQNFDTVRTAIDGAWTKFQATFPNAAAVLQNIGEKAGWLADKIKSVFGMGQAAAADVSLQIPAYANGTIATKPHLGLFAENGPEAVIPLDGSSRAMSLWATAGQMLGLGGSSLFEDFTESPAGGRGEFTFVFSPNVYLDGGDSEVESKVRQTIRNEEDDFERRMNAWAAQQRRLGYA